MKDIHVTEEALEQVRDELEAEGLKYAIEVGTTIRDFGRNPSINIHLGATNRNNICVMSDVMSEEVDDELLFRLVEKAKAQLEEQQETCCPECGR
ncbi:MAG: hypothetical protein ACLFVJ_18845 [Persicimonas sp.]